MIVRPDECNRILIVKLSSIGDVVLTTPVAKALRGAFPESYIAWIVEPKSKDAVEGNPYLDDVIVWRRTTAQGPSDVWHTLRGLRPIVETLKSHSFDVALDFQGLLRSASLLRLSGARYRIGFGDSREGAPILYNIRMPSQTPEMRGPRRYLSLLQTLGIYCDDPEMHVPVQPEDRAFAAAFLDEAGRGRPVERIVAMCPATTWPQKHWTEQGWAELADALISKHGALPVFLGSKADIPLLERICAMMEYEPASAVGLTTLKQAAAIEERSDLVIAVDTGLLHIATAVKRPVVGIFGPTHWRHLDAEDNLIAVVKELPCAPCLRHPTCRDFDCMRAISAEDVLEVAAAWLG